MTRKEVTRAQRQVFDGPLAERLAKAKSWLVRVNQELERTSEKIRAVNQDYHEAREGWSGRPSPPTEPPRVDQEAVAKGRRMAFGAWAARLLETVFAAALAAVALTLPPVWAVVVGIVVAFLLAIIMEGAAMRFMRRDGPAQSLRRAEKWIGVTFFISIVALAPLAVARTVEQATVLSGPCLAVLTVMLPMLGAVLGVAAFALDSSGRLTRAYDRLLVERAETEQFRRELVDFIARHEGQEEDPGPDSHPSWKGPDHASEPPHHRNPHRRTPRDHRTR